MTKFTSFILLITLLFAACAGERKATKTTSSIKTAKETNLKIVNALPISGYVPLEIRNLVMPIANNCNNSFINFNTASDGGPIISRLDDENVFMQINTPFSNDKSYNAAELIGTKMQKVLNERRLSLEFGKAYEKEFDVTDALNLTISQSKKANDLVYIFSKATQKLSFSDLPIYNNEEVLRNAIARDLCSNDKVKNVVILYGVNDKLLTTKAATTKAVAENLQAIKNTEVKKVETPKVLTDNTVKKADLVTPTVLPVVKPIVKADSTAKAALPLATKTDGKTLPKTDVKKDAKLEPKKDDKKNNGLEKENIRKNIILKSDTQ